MWYKRNTKQTSTYNSKYNILKKYNETNLRKEFLPLYHKSHSTRTRALLCQHTDTNDIQCTDRTRVVEASPRSESIQLTMRFCCEPVQKDQTGALSLSIVALSRLDYLISNPYIGFQTDVDDIIRLNSGIFRI